MYKQDYLMRMLKQFFEMLEKLIEMKKKKKHEEVQVYLNEIFNSFLEQPKEFYSHLSTEEIIHSFQEEQREIKVEIVAELFYQDASLNNDTELFRKSLILYEYLQKQSSTYSFGRAEKIEKIKAILQEATAQNEEHNLTI